MDVRSLLDPEIAEVLVGVAGLEGVTLEQIPAVRAERDAARLPVHLSDAVERRDLLVPGPEGAPAAPAILDAMSAGCYTGSATALRSCG
jgi:hypothetical protein